MPTLTDPRINEASSLACSNLWPIYGYLCNDEGTKPHYFVVELATGAVKGSGSIYGRSIIDPEALSVGYRNIFWYGDIGDNDANRDDVAIYARGEAGPGYHGSLGFTRYLISYPGGARNAEALLAHPLNPNVYIVSKQATSKVYRLPTNPKTTGHNLLVDTGITLGANVSDAAFTPDGRFILTRREGQLTTVYVHDAADPGWAAAAGGNITVTSQPKPEGLSVQKDQLAFWIDTEGVDSSLLKVTMPTAYRKLAPPAPTPLPAEWPSPSNPCG